jgi:hypothetical protein
MASNGLARLKARSTTLKELIHTFRPNYDMEQLNDRNYLRVLEQLAEESRTSLISKLTSDSSTVHTLAIDGMTAFGRKFINLVVLSVDDADYWYTVDIGAESDTKELDMKILYEQLDDLERHEITIHCLVSDNAPNIRSAVKRVAAKRGLIDLGCSAHQIQLLANTFLGEESIKAQLVVFDQLIRNFTSAKGSKDRRHRLKTEFDADVNVIAPNDTRWFGRYFSYDRLVRLREDIDNFTEQELECAKPTDAQWAVLFDVILVLECFFDVSNTFQSDTNTLWVTYQGWNKVQELIKHWQLTRNQTFGSNLLKRFEFGQVLQPVIDKWTVDESSANALKAVKLLDVCRSRSQSVLTRSSGSEPVTKWISTKGAAFLICTDDDKRWKVGDLVALKAKIKTQVENYLQGQGAWVATQQESCNMKGTPNGDVPITPFDNLRYFTDRVILPECMELCLFVRGLFHCISSEAAVERSFSAHTIIHSDLRNRLNVQHIIWEMRVRYDNIERKPRRDLAGQKNIWHSQPSIEEYLIECGDIDFIMDDALWQLGMNV